MKASVFNIFTPGWIENTFIGFNTFTGSFITLDRERFVAVSTILEQPEEQWPYAPGADELVPVLRQGGFLVDDGADEHAAVEERYWASRDKVRGVALTIAPTIACNLRCTYCFEEHPNKKMSQRDLDLTLDYVRANLEEETSLGVVWFGGEPMLAVDQIVAFAPRLKEEAEARGCSYHQSLITNGVLFTRETGKKLATVGPFDSVQITLDGPPRIHDLRRWTVARKGTFDTILKNVVANADDFNIQLRVNVDRTNYAHLGEFVQILEDAGLRGRVSVYLGHAYSYANTAGDLGSNQLNIEEFASVEAQFKLMMFKKGFELGSSLPRPQMGSHCVADNPKGAVISPGGKVFKCWNETAMSADNAIGMLGGEAQAGLARSADAEPRGIRVRMAEPESDAQREVRRGWEDYSPFTQRDCKSCRVRPLCVGGCPWEVRLMPTTEGPGHCTALRFNIEDTLRLHHLKVAVSRTMLGEQDSAGPVDACQA